jgi:peptidoglycan/LPS O-acetylase OafA/YrhL
VCLSSAALFLPGEFSIGLRDDALGTLVYATNWRFLVGGTSYAEINGASSPVLHFWSLAIEEQFYLVWPAVVAALLRWRSRRAVGWAAVVTIVGSVITSAVLNRAGTSVDHLYLATYTRAAELGVGSLVAVALPLHRHAGRPGRYSWLGPVALLGPVTMWATVPQQSRWLYPGGLLVHAVCFVVAIAACVQTGWFGRVLALRPLRRIGGLSYGIYLYHWPVFLVVDSRRTGLSGTSLLVCRGAVAIGLAWVSSVVIEQPVRERRTLTGWRVVLAVPVALGLVGAVVASSTARSPACAVAHCEVDIAAAASPVVVANKPPLAPTPTTTGVASPPISASPDDPVTVPVTASAVLFVGDSGMFNAAPALAAAYGSLGFTTIDASYPGVGLANGSADWRTIWHDIFQQHDVALVVAMVGGWDAEFRRAAGAEAYGAILDDAADALTEDGGHLLWVSILPGGSISDIEINADIQALDERDGRVSYYDAWPLMTAADGTFPRRIDGKLYRKPDGWHLCQAGAEAIARGATAEVARLGWAEEPADVWQSGLWATDVRYDEPPGGCDP